MIRGTRLETAVDRVCIRLCARGRRGSYAAELLWRATGLWRAS